MNWNWKDNIKDINYVKKLCKQWENNKLINPITNSKIKENKVTYNTISNVCNSKIILDKSDDKSDEKSDDKSDEKSDKKSDEKLDEYFPKNTDKKFIEKLHNLQEMTVHTTSKIKDLQTKEDFEKQTLIECPSKGFNKAYFQYYIQQYMSKRTPYNNILLYYSMGVGKSCSAVTIAEGFLENHNSYDEELVWVILPKSLKTNFYNTIYDFALYNEKQCTNDLYLKLAKIKKNTPVSEAKQKIMKIIKQRYKILTYGEFISEVKGIPSINNKIFIIDEAHNLRNKVETFKNTEFDDEDEDVTKEYVKTYNVLSDILKNGNNNRLILMTGTPMYNQPEEIINLLNLFLINDKETPIDIKKFYDNNKISDKMKEIISELSKRYISYINNNNPFSYSIRLSPANAIKDYSLIPIKITEKEKYKWINNIRDGVILVKLGKAQEQYHIDNYRPTHNISGLSDLESTNIVYGKNIGKTGFETIFNIIKKEGISLSLKYRDETKQILSEPLLSKYANKISVLLENIKNNTGITIIYSKFLWGGIIPSAIALEHVGYSRYGVKNNILNNTKNKKLNYAILTTSVSDLMGSDSFSFDKLINDINNDNNKNGEKINVVLITQKASEGISFKNIREIHILEPWYHINRSEQIIGRGIRRCSHIKLPLEKRNTLVYQYCGYIEDKITKDVQTFNIAGNKVKNVEEITDIIKENSIDCGIHKHLNYYSKDIFKFETLDIYDSKNNKIMYNFKNNQKELKCVSYEGKDKRGVIKKNMNITENLKNKIIDYILLHNKKWYSIDEIFDTIKTYEGDDIYLYEAINKCLFPNEIIDNNYLYLNKGGIQLVKKSITTDYTSIRINDKKTDDLIQKIEPNIENILTNIINIEDKFARLFRLYKIFTTSNYNDLILNIIKYDIYLLLRDDLYFEGIILKQNNIIIGYINIFSDKIEALNLNKEDISQDILDKILKNYDTKQIKQKEKYGKIEKKYNKKEKHYEIDFKLYISKNSKGASCFNKNKTELKKDFEKIDITQSTITICFNIANELYNNNNFYFLPNIKPKK